MTGRSSAATTSARRLSRSSLPGRPPAPVRIVHLGLGNFFRAHQAWYTERAEDGRDWGIAAFTGRTPTSAEALAQQDGLYTLVTRSPDRDHFDVIGSLTAAHAASDHSAWLAYLRAPELALITLTVTEAAYLRAPTGGLAANRDDVRADVAALRHDAMAPVRTVPGRLVAGLLARHRAGSGPVAVVPCDNLPGNGTVTARVVNEMAKLVGREAIEAVSSLTSFVNTMADRITPGSTSDDREVVRVATGLEDAAPVVTESFSEWVISGRFPAGRPHWEGAGARLVDDILPFEQRKLWLLNGAHSLLAYAGSLRGHDTVSEAIYDEVCRSWVEEWWDIAIRQLILPMNELTTYRTALLERFENPRIRHSLAQIAADGSQKVPARVLAVLQAEQAAGRVSAGASRIVSAWISYLRRPGAVIRDVGSDEVVPLAGGHLPDAVRRVLGWLDPSLGDDDRIVALVQTQADMFSSGPR